MEDSQKTTAKKAPEFTLSDETGEPRSLSQLLQHGSLMIVFYPGDFTPVCTRQLCNYRDDIKTFSEQGIQIVGISGNSPESHAKFKKQYGLPFPLLTDLNNLVARDYGCTSKLLFGAVSRAIIIVATDGSILYKHVEATPLTRRKSDELLQIIKALPRA